MDDERHANEFNPILPLEAPASPHTRKHHREKHYFFDFVFESVRFYVALIAFLQGLFSLTTLAVFMYQKNTLKLEPATIQFAGGLLGIPWCVKPIFGYLIDQFLNKYKKSKWLITGTSLIQLTILGFMGHFEPSVVPFYVLNFVFMCCTVVQNIISEYLLCIQTMNSNTDSGTTHNEFPIYFGFRGVGSLIGSFLGGRLIKDNPLGLAFYFASFICPLLAASSVLHREAAGKRVVAENRSVREEVRIIKNLVLKKELLILIISLCVINLCPNFDSMSTFFLTDKLGFSTEDLADLNSISTLAYIVGLAFYYRFLVGVSPRRLFLVSNVLLFLGNVSFMAVVFDRFKDTGVSPKLFCLLNYGVYSFVAELNSMPVLAIWTSYIPANLEATSVTLFTGISNLSSNLSNYTGTLVLAMAGVDSEDLDRVWIPLTVQNIYFILVILALFCVPIPDPSKLRGQAHDHPTLSKAKQSYELVSA